MVVSAFNRLSGQTVTDSYSGELEELGHLRCAERRAWLRLVFCSHLSFTCEGHPPLLPPAVASGPASWQSSPASFSAEQHRTTNRSGKLGSQTRLLMPLCTSELHQVTLGFKMKFQTICVCTSNMILHRSGSLA